MKTISEILAAELNQPLTYIENVITLLDEGNSIPFIARYRKEKHGAMDDTSLRTLENRLNSLRNLQARRDEVKNSIEKQGKLTPELAAAIDVAATMTEVEDIYRPYKQKRRTRGSIAREKGLEPLAEMILRQDSVDYPKMAIPFIDTEKGINTAEDALAGASDIIAEDISDHADIRRSLRLYAFNRGNFQCKAEDAEKDSVYSLYYAFSSPVNRLQNHQILAINRGEKEGFLKAQINLTGNDGTALICRGFFAPGKPTSAFLRNAAEDAYTRLLWPSIQREIRNELTDRACEGAIQNFALNLRPLLMQPPVKGYITMGLDPGYSHGCKVAVVDPTGKVLDTTVVYPTFSDRKKQEAIEKLSGFIRRYNVLRIAIGNGTASKETELMTAEMLKAFPDVRYMVVSEAGASVYSASPIAAEEFPDYDVNLRSAVSIARRMQDPLAELVKIDPKAIGVGQYQHDCPQKDLDIALSGVVEDCVNSVGVDINTASWSLLGHISGLNSTTARNIVIYREENGPFISRTQLKKVPKLGPKAFEQSAGFLRIPESKEILDNTGVHPESYSAAKKLIELLKPDHLTNLPEKLQSFGVTKAAELCGIGALTISDIASELAKPGRDPRDDLPEPILRQDIMNINDLKVGMVLQGTVRNVIDFGVFVDIGVHQDGLVHISEICQRKLRHPSELLQIGDIVKTVVIGIDTKKNRISLSMKQAAQ